MIAAISACITVLVACWLLALTASGAAADEGTLGDGKEKWMKPVWKSRFAMEQGMTLLQAKEQDLAIRYMACFVPSGTRVVAMYVNEHVYRVVVREGKERGCEGYVSAGEFRATGTK